MDTGLAGAAFTGPVSTFTGAGIAFSEDNAMSGVGVGGTVKIIPTMIDSIRACGVTHHNLMGIVGAFPETLADRFGFHIGGIISHAFFRPYALTFDFERMHHYLGN